MFSIKHCFKGEMKFNHCRENGFRKHILLFSLIIIIIIIIIMVFLNYTFLMILSYAWCVHSSHPDSHLALKSSSCLLPIIAVTPE